MKKTKSAETAIKREEKSESTARLPPSAAEQLDKVRLILAMNGYEVKDLTPKKREFSGAGYAKPDTYISPIEFSVKGVEFGMYGNRLTVDGKPIPANFDIYNIEQTYRTIANILKNRTEERKPSKSKLATTSTLTARYLAACLGA